MSGEPSRYAVPVRQVVVPVLTWGEYGPKNVDRSYLLGAFWCPGCNTVHIFHAGHNPVDDPDSPTVAGELGDAACRCTIKDGQVTYSTSCAHNLAGRSVALLIESNWPVNLPRNN